MACIEDHCRESIELYGKPYCELHLWLDEFAGKPGIGMRHRRFRHHRAGIEEAARLFGDAVREVAERHVMTDLEEEGWREGVDRFPADQADYVRMGLY